MTNNREAALIEIEQTLQDVITPLLESDCSAANDYYRDINHRFCDHLMKIGYYFAQLSKLGLWPITQQLHAQNKLCRHKSAIDEDRGLLG